MRLRGVGRGHLDEIMKEFPSIRLEVYDARTVKPRGSKAPVVEMRLRLVMARLSQKETGTARFPYDNPVNEYRKRGFSGKWTGAVCYHGYTAWMDRVFETFHDAVMLTKFATFNGAEDYKAKRDGVGMTPAGSMFNPQQYREQCDCYGG